MQIIFEQDPLNCSECCNLFRKTKEPPVCRVQRCRNAAYMGDSVGEFISFWHSLRATESVPKEYLMDIADAKDPTTLSLLIMLDKEAARLKELRREAEAKKR